MKEEIKSFKFVAFQYYEDTEINDQNVHQFEFINLTTSTIVLNNSIVLQPNLSPHYKWKEDIQSGEKTEGIYRIRFFPPLDSKVFGLLVIAKMPVKPRI